MNVIELIKEKVERCEEFITHIFLSGGLGGKEG